MTSKRSGGAAALILLIGIWLTLHDRLCPSFQVEGDDEIVSLLLLLWDVSAFICSLHLISTGDSYEGATSAFSSDTFLPHILPPFIEKTQKIFISEELLIVFVWISVMLKFPRTLNMICSFSESACVMKENSFCFLDILFSLRLLFSIDFYFLLRRAALLFDPKSNTVETQGDS